MSSGLKWSEHTNVLFLFFSFGLSQKSNHFLAVLLFFGNWKKLIVLRSMELVESQFRTEHFIFVYCKIQIGAHICLVCCDATNVCLSINCAANRGTHNVIDMHTYIAQLWAQEIIHHLVCPIVHKNNNNWSISFRTLFKPTRCPPALKASVRPITQPVAVVSALECV